MISDIRAEVVCSLGPLIKGSISDSFDTGSGISYTRGEAEIRGIYGDLTGEKIEFAYIKNGSVSRIPRSLFVISSFSNPFTNITSLSLGCAFTLNEGLKPIPEEGIQEEEEECPIDFRATPYKSASIVANQALSALGIAGSVPPLTNEYARTEWDFSSGYLQSLSDLCVSENYVMYINSSGTASYKTIGNYGGSGPLIDENDIISVSDAGSGEKISEKATVTYGALRLKAPEDQSGEEERLMRDWEEEIFTGLQVTGYLTYTDENDQVIQKEFSYTPYSKTTTEYDSWNRATKRTVRTETATPEANNRYAIDKMKVASQAYFGNGPGIETVSRQSETTWKYRLAASTDQTICGEKSDPPEGYEDVISETTINYISEIEVAATLSIDSYLYDVGNGQKALIDTFSTAWMQNYIESKQTIYYEKDESSGISKTTTEHYMMYGKTTTGQQDLAAVANSRPATNNVIQLRIWIEKMISQAQALKYLGRETKIRTEREYGLQRRPNREQRNNSANSSGDPSENKSAVEIQASGGNTPGINEFSMPLAPDDIIFKSSTGSWTSTDSGADGKANAFLEAQLKLLTGKKYGINIQIPIELLPPSPLSMVYISIRGKTGAYINNNTTYVFDSNGIITGFDGIFVGGVS